MRGYVANTDYDELSFLRAIVPPVDEINFWKVGTDASFKALSPGEPLFFRVKAPYNAIGGFGYFAHFSVLPLSIAWQTYGIANGSPGYPELRHRLELIRGRFGMAVDAKSDFRIGCILVNQPVYFEPGAEVRPPSDWSDRIVQGKTYDLTTGEGARLWNECLARSSKGHHLGDAFDLHASASLIRPRLGPRSFRIAVLDAYGRRCAISGEQALPALEAAHIRHFGDAQEHSVNNGILLRADIQRLFESGYATVDRDLRFRVSRKISDEFAGGKSYESLDGALMRFPDNPAAHPLPEALWWHNEEQFLG